MAYLPFQRHVLTVSLLQNFQLSSTAHSFNLIGELQSELNISKLLCASSNMVNHSSPVNHPTDSDETLVDSISDHQMATSQCSVPYVEDEPLPDPSYFDTLFEDIDGPLPGFPMRVPDLDCMVWGHLPSPDQFEVDEVGGVESRERPALDVRTSSY